MYNNQYFNQQLSIDKLNEQINNLEKLKAQMQQPIQQPTNLTQNFQLAPSNRDVIRYANSIEEVQRDMVIGDTPYFSKDMSVVWIKNTKGEIKTYELEEIIPKDEKDIQIELLQNEVEKLRKEVRRNEQFNSNDVATEDTTNTTRNDETNGRSTKESESTSIQRISTSKKKQ
jgi:hypothetical protein